MSGTMRPGSVSTKLLRIAELARREPKWVLTTLAHLIDVEFLEEAYRRTRKDGAAGVDGQTAEAYGTNLKANLQSLLDRFKSGSYHAPPVRRVYIPKGDSGKVRPIGIPTFEDKVLQRAVAMVLEAVYEQDFRNCSYGFRPGRSAHQALEALWQGLTEMGGGWVVEMDIQSFFDTMDHGRLRAMLDRRVRDGVLRRTIDKWLKAGVLEEGRTTRSELGTPQGGVISPLLANLYLHEVLDTWFEDEIKPRLKGRGFLIRYADDAVLVFSSEAEARGVLAVLPKRFGRYGLRLHPEKTRLVQFRRPDDRRGDRPETFDLLGFTHYWGKSLRGFWVVKRKTAASRLRRGLQAIWAWCRKHRHHPVAEQHGDLVRKLRGHYAYYGITGNGRALQDFLYRTGCAWRYWLDHRSQRAKMQWDRFNALLTSYPLPAARVVHSIYRPTAKPCH